MRGASSASDLTAEERVVVVEPRVALLVVGGAAVEHDALEDLRPRAMRAQLGAGRIVGAHEHPLELCGETGSSVANGVVQRGDEQHERRDALLAVDQHELGRIVRRARRGEDRADEVHVAVVRVGDRADVGEQLLASADVPPVLTLIDRHDDASSRAPTARRWC